MPAVVQAFRLRRALRGLGLLPFEQGDKPPTEQDVVTALLSLLEVADQALNRSPRPQEATFLREAVRQRLTVQPIPEYEWGLLNTRSGKIRHRTTSPVEAHLLINALRHKGFELVRRTVTGWETFDDGDQAQTGGA